MDLLLLGQQALTLSPVVMTLVAILKEKCGIREWVTRWVALVVSALLVVLTNLPGLQAAPLGHLAPLLVLTVFVWGASLGVSLAVRAP